MNIRYTVTVTVWAVVAKFGVIGPNFFEENGRSVTVNSARYVVMIRNFLIPELRRCQLNQFQIWFQQDGATAHTSREAMAKLRRLFPGKLISHRGDVPWLPPLLRTCHLAISFCGGTSKEKCMSTSHEIFLTCRMQMRGKCMPYLTECVSR